LYLSTQSKHKSTVLSELHATPTTEHSGFTKNYDSVKRSFLWDGMKQDVRNFVAECDVFQHNKGETVKSPGTLMQEHRQQPNEREGGRQLEDHQRTFLNVFEALM
jgi:hypothetical protein